jgi:hypothetical protein
MRALFFFFARGASRPFVCPGRLVGRIDSFRQ